MNNQHNMTTNCKTSPVKRILIFLLCIVLITSTLCTFSSCIAFTRILSKISSEMYTTQNNIQYCRAKCMDEEDNCPDEVKAWGDFYYEAGRIDEYDKNGEPITVRHIAAEINGIPVLKLNFSMLMNEGAGKCKSKTLKKLYAPGTVISEGGYLAGTSDDLIFFYSGKPYKYYKSHSVMTKTYVPNGLYSEFIKLLDEDAINVVPLYKANVSYRLNVQELPKYYQTEYYYVDYVEYGQAIENIPPNPTIKGYKFGGWYMEAECINKWDFENVVPRLAEGEDFNELCLYAKWI